MRPRIGPRGRGASVPRLWLLSDPARLPDPLPLLPRLPRGAAVLLRGAPPALAAAVAHRARARGLLLVLAGEGRGALALRAGLHLPEHRVTRHLFPFLLMRRHAWRQARPLLSLAVHGRAGVARARRVRADVALVSPVFPTASHPGAPALGPLRWAALARALPCPAVALGGLSARRARRLPRGLCAGWAAIGAWAGGL
jgi:thiamine-phosphate pyrophosphorylase